MSALFIRVMGLKDALKSKLLEAESEETSAVVSEEAAE